MIMRKRIPLKLNTELRFKNHDNGEVCYVTGEVIGCGGTCIVYEGYYLNNSGCKKTVRIKECYPYKLHLFRMDDGKLVVSESETRKFNEYKDRLRRSFDITNDLFMTSGLSNSVSNTLDIYEFNNTIYIVSSYVEGMTLSNYEIGSLKDAVKLVVSTAKSIGKIHNKGYLYLDIKPDNILVFGETTELVQLFDFDSVIPINTGDNLLDYRISYSTGFAPIEQKKADLKMIGKYSDVYSIGALLFYLIFGKAPRAFDCGLDVTYDYWEMRWRNCYQNKLYVELTKLFHGTLQSYYGDRFSSMEDLVEQLLVVEKYADLSKPFILSSTISANELCVGREMELKKIYDLMNEGAKCLFVTGMGGIGKSTLVRKYLCEREKCFDNIVYLYFNESVCNTITDDAHFYINNCEKTWEETKDEYFKRKIKGIKRICYDTNSVIVLDNFDGDINEHFLEVVNSGLKIIAVTRKDMRGSGYPSLKVGEIENHNSLYEIFAANLGQEIVHKESSKIERIIKLVAGHTLSLELIAKQIAYSYLSFDEAISLATDNGFYDMAPEKVESFKDGKRVYDRVSLIIKAVYDASSIDECKQKVLKLLALFDAPGIAVKELQDLAELNSLDEINELHGSGWLNIANGYAYLHPLIQGTIHNMEWSEECLVIVIGMMNKLFEFMRNIVSGMIQKKGTLGEITLGNVQGDHKLLEITLRKAKSLLNYCRGDGVLSKESIYKDLMYVTVINMPKDQEEFIIKYTDIMINDDDFRNPYEIMELYNYIVYIYCQRQEFESAREKLDQAYRFAKKQSDNYFRGLYYDMLMDFYEAVLDGAYAYENKDEKEVFSELLAACDKAIHYMSKSSYVTAKGLLAKYMLGKAALIIRSFPDKIGKINNLIRKAKCIIEQYTLECSKVSGIYYMTLAWYGTLCKPDMESVLHNLQMAKKIHDGQGIWELDSIDYYYVPAANMMWELENIEKSLELLSEAISICRAREDSIPFMRKELDLLGYMLDVYYDQGDFVGCKKIVRSIDSFNERSTEYGVFKEIPEALREEIYSN